LGRLEGQPLSARRSITGVDETAESVETFSRRTEAWWDKEIVNKLTVALEQPIESTRAPLQILLVSHGGFISSLVKILISSGRVRPPDEPITNWTCFNVSITTIELEQTGKGQVVKYSDISHLDSSKLLHANADTFVA
jgi:2,3-bisphosphoglycerate-dependent phosphoglycerate mutase